MEYSDTRTVSEPLKKFLSCRVVDFNNNQCVWSVAKQREYLNALLSEENDDDNLTHFSGFSRDVDGDYIWYIDGNNRIVTLIQYMNGRDRLYWNVGKDKVVYAYYGKLKRGYRLMTEEESDKFLNTILTIDVDCYKSREHSRKRSLSTDDIPTESNQSKATKLTD